MVTRLVNRTERLAAIEQMLFRNAIGLRVVEIAESCGVDRRTVYRDLALLNEVGVPLHQKDGRFFIDREHYLARIRLNFDETFALFMAARVLSRYADQHNPHIISAIEKLSAALPNPLAAHADLTLERGREGSVSHEYTLILQTIARAWGEQRKVRIWCTSGSDKKLKAREFAIYFIEPAPNGSLYLVGFDDLTHRVRAFKLQRVKRARLLQTSYHLPYQFDPRRYLCDEWGSVADNEEKTRITLIFSPELTPYLQERVRQIQRIELLENKRCMLNVLVSDWHEMLPWIRSWGTQVEVLEPAALREQLAAEAAYLMSAYSANV